MDIAKLTGGNQELQTRYITEVGADNLKAKTRIANLKSELDSLEPANPMSSLQRSPQKTLVSIQTNPQPVQSIRGTDSPQQEDNIILSASQQQQVNLAIEDGLREKAEGLNKIKEGIHILHVEIEEKTMRRDELQRLYEERKNEVEKAEKDTRNEMKNLNKEIDTDAIYSKRELFNLKQEIEATDLKLNKVQKELETLSKEREMNEKMMEEIKKEADDSYAFKVAKAKSAIAPLEDAAKQIEFQREKLQARLNIENSDFVHELDILNMLEEDYNGHEIQKQEMIKMRKNLLEQMASFKDNYKEELQLFFEGLEVDEMLENVKKEKRKIEGKMQKNEKFKIDASKKLEEINETLEKMRQLIEQNQENLIGALKMNTQDLNEYEEKMKKILEDDIGCEPLWKILMDEIQKKGFSYGKALFLVQKKLVDQEIDKLLSEETQNEDSLKKKIKDVQNSMKETDGEAIKKGKENQIKFMEDKLIKMKMLFQAKMEGIERWRIQMKAKYKVTDEDSKNLIPKELLENDNEILNSVTKKILIKIEHPGERQDFEKLLSDYLFKVKEREQEIQKIYAKLQNAKNRLDEVLQEKISNEKKLSEIDQETVKFKAEYNSILLKEKALEHQIFDRNAQLELELRKQGEEDFQEFLKKNEHIFKGVKKTYGAKMSEKIKQEHKKEIIELAICQQAERRNMIKDVHKTIQHLNEMIENTEIPEKLLPVINIHKKDCGEKQIKITKLRTTLAGVIEAENEAIVQIEDYLRKKKSELLQHLQTFYKKRNYEFTAQKLFDLHQSLEKKHMQFSNLQNKLENLRKTREEKRTSFAIRKVQQKMKFEAIRKQFDEIQKVFKVQLTALGKQLTNCHLQIVNDKKKVGILNDKLSSGINNLKLTKQILGQKYKNVEEVCLPEPELEPQPEIIVDKENEDENFEEEKHESVGEPFSKENESSSAQNPPHEIENLVAENAASEKFSVVANPSENSNAPKYGCINVNLADLNVTGSEVENQGLEPENEEELKEWTKNEQKSIQKTENEDEPGRFLYSSFNEKKSRYKIDTTICPIREMQLFDSIKTLLEGMLIYKKYTTQNLLKERAFDPLHSQKYPPESCGYGKRFFVYNPNTNKIEVRIPNKMNVSELILPISQIQRIIVPNETKKIIKAQRLSGTIVMAKGGDFMLDDDKKGEGKLDKLWRDTDNGVFIEQCKNVNYYQFSILTNDKRIELIADSYTIFKYAVQALNQLLIGQSIMKELNKFLIMKTEENIAENLP